jgi:hypothetical protein
VKNEDLAVAGGSRADADRRNSDGAGDPLRDGGRDALEDDREAAGLLERDRVLEQLACLRGRAALGAETAEHRRGLRRQADVAHHRDPCADEREHA